MSVTLHTTLGDIKIEVLCELVPIASYNFLALCASGYYNGCIFHRNIPKFMIQTGDPTGTGKGGESIYKDKFQDEFRDEIKHIRGTVSMANSGPNTNQSQFFICYKDLPRLDKQYTAFGKVIHGFEVLDAMEKVPTGPKNRPVTPIVLRSITIHANPIADEE
eukprot:TRINITY_DN12168_c0_g1_i1.p1 TRINITY_DN12168_c0_g1~~TRINITY_DN12168_c0_g1_i1.p1  ORF type:complete len:162 (+),score=25.42 TRINITY_DN12168_c0_g1_i1:71-556(+)